MRFGRTTLTLCLVLFSLASHAGANPQIFILHSYSQEYPWTKRQHEGFIESLEAESANEPIIRTEYLDTKRKPYDTGYAGYFAEHLARKYEGYAPDVIYVTDDNA